MKATILNHTITGLLEIVTVMHYEGIEFAKLDNGKTIEVTGEGTHYIY